MQDEQFIQSWNAGHTQFSADLDHGLSHLRERFARRGKGAKGNRDPYGIPTEVESRASLSPAARASLRGLAASVVTAALWLVVMALATPTPGLAASPVTAAASTECLAHPLVA
jgi:hypothetical protein